MTSHIDLNADAGESFGRYTLGDDGALMRVVSSVSVACGWHAGDPGVIRRTIAMARDAGVSVGAHPGFPDLQGFGRREMHMAPDDVRDAVIYQVAAVAGLARAEGVTLDHVKPHGALYNMACRDPHLADAIVTAVASVDPALAVYGLPDSALVRAAAAAGLRVVPEGFLDRQYEADGSLTPRTVAGAVIDDPAAGARRALQWMQHGSIEARTGERLSLRVAGLCVHGDTPGAAALVRAVRETLEAAGIRVGGGPASTAT